MVKVRVTVRVMDMGGVQVRIRVMGGINVKVKGRVKMITLEPFPESKIDEVIAYLRFAQKRHKRKLEGSYVKVSFNCSSRALAKVDQARGRAYRSVYVEELIQKTQHIKDLYSPYPKTKVTSVSLTKEALDKLERMAYNTGITRSEALERLMLQT